MAKEMSYLQASRQALTDAMAADGRVTVLGIDVRTGTFGHTFGLCEQFGTDRVFDTPFAEASIVGLGIGLALAGRRPFVEIMFSDYLSMAMDAICNTAASWRYMGGGQYRVPLVIRSLTGAGGRGGPPHSQSTEPFFLQVPGVTVVLPSTPDDVYGLTRSALLQEDPVLIFEHPKLFSKRGPVTGELIPPGRAAVRRTGQHITLLAALRMVEHAMAAAELLAAEGIDVEVIDLRSLVPLDMDTIGRSVRKTHHLVTVEESRLRGGWGAELITRVVESMWDDLDAPPARVGAPMVPVPAAWNLEKKYLPGVGDVAQAVRQVLAG